MIDAAVKPLNEKVTGLETQLAAKDKEIEALKKKPGSTPASVKDENPSDTELGVNKDKPWMNSAINRKVAGMQNTKPKA